MLRPIVQTAVLLSTALAALFLAAADLPPLLDQQILVLRNGQTIEGRITQSEGVYVIDLSDGQIRVKPADVDLICNSLVEGYQRKRSGVQIGNVHHHLELAQWCLRHQLLEQAAIELADAKTAEPGNAMIGALERRLKMALEPPAVADAAGKTISGPSNDELDRMVRSLPHGAVETFTQSVQPLLMNHCATSGCHGPQASNGLRLLRVPTNKMASRRITQRNLYSVLPYIDRDNPVASRLLTAPGGPHGSAQYAIFNEHQATQYNRLVYWAGQFSPQGTPDVPATLTPLIVQTPPDFPPNPPQVLSQEARKARPLPIAGQGQTAKRGAAHVPAKPAAEAAPASYDQSTDQFDPEVFNRRYAPQKNQPASRNENAEEHK